MTEDPPISGLLKVALYVDDVDAAEAFYGGVRGAAPTGRRTGPFSLFRLRRRLEGLGVNIESAFDWPHGGCSIYVRDPVGDSLEFAEPRIWGIQ